MNINLKYNPGEKVKTEHKILMCIGFEYIKGRGIRYIFLTLDCGKPLWEYLYDFEIKMLE